ncbi:hypothetical protein CATRI_10080 [Corynebacterium atrinae]|uniref:hypothetical protein n=1 Tax=Corynebacterium atrinae TaxID=1336740 RepID=UPI0025B433B0|nr:hypothetical protein [Corynebacterium atrinae]WJY64079.1 hypothetical protein CATRI_10080 [Corynebacterium atrinae]
MLLVLLSLFAVAGVLAAVLMVRKCSTIDKFPWFWLFFGTFVVSLVVLVTMSVGMDMARSGSVTYSVADPEVDIFLVYNLVVTSAIVLAIVGLVGSVWALRKRRY